MDVSLPQDVWVLIATELLQCHGRDDFLHLRAASKSTFHALDYAPLWKDMIFQTHFRLFDKADPSMMDAMTAPHWRKLLLGFSALGLRSQDDKVGFRDLKRTKVLRWLPEWGEKDEEDEEKATTKNEENTDSKNEEENASGEEDANEDDADDGYIPEGDELMAKNEIIYGLSTLTNTCSFWFSHRKAKDGSPLDIKIGDLVNGDPMRQLESDGYRTLVDNEELVKSLYSIYPRLGKNEVEMTALHAVITPEYIGPNEDTYIVDPVYRWDEIKYFPKRNIGCYRYKAPINPLPCHTHGATRLTHVLLPLQDPERVGFNEERVSYYQEQMKQGALPTVLALSRVINKYRYYDFNDPSLDFREQQIVVHAIIDGHHKLEAARRLNWPVGILMVCPARDRVVLEAIHRPIPCWPYSRLEFDRLASASASNTLVFDNFFGSHRRLNASEQREALVKLLCHGGHRPEDVFKGIVSFAETGQRLRSYHGGFIEFTTREHLLRVLRECSGVVENSLGPICFQFGITPALD